MTRYATIDIGTNSVLLLVAERDAQRLWQPVLERAEITRLGRGVDATGTLSAEGMEATLTVLETFAREARAAGALQIAVTATSAARDAKNGAEFRAAAKQRAGLEVEIISGDDEARFSFSAVRDAWRARVGDRPLVVIDIGGGSTEFIYGAPGAADEIAYRRSFDVGAVRLTERFVRKEDPPSESAMLAMEELLVQTFAEAPSPAPGAMVVGVAGTVTTLFALQHRMATYDASRVEGGVLELEELHALRQRLAILPLAERKALPGLQPKRADVIPAGAMILEQALRRLGASSVGVSDRGLRWGLLAARFGTEPQ